MSTISSKYDNTKKEISYCEFPWKQIKVFSNGDVSMCCWQSTENDGWELGYKVDFFVPLHGGYLKG